jgi:hypothetical protein
MYKLAKCGVPELKARSQCARRHAHRCIAARRRFLDAVRLAEKRRAAIRCGQNRLNSEL